jgi:hypothetical protein
MAGRRLVCVLRGPACEKQAFIWAFEVDGEDVRALTLERRKGELKVLLNRASLAWRSTTTSPAMGPHCSRKPVPWGWMASSRSDLALPVGPVTAVSPLGSSGSQLVS